MKIAVVGSVASTEVLVQALAQYRLGTIAIWGYEPLDTKQVAGWRNLRQLANELKLEFIGFRKVADCEASLRSFAPDILFIVGLSQIAPSSILSIATKANIGFHPTSLPSGRGRAALAWMILKGDSGAATFFKLQNGVDDGAIFIQEPFTLSNEDDAADVEAKVLEAEKVALGKWLPRLAQGDLTSIEQDHSAATWLGRRTHEDGWLNWNEQGDILLRLIRASAPPHPGAYTFCLDHKILILKATVSERKESGVPGRILATYPEEGFDVQTGTGILKIMEWRSQTDWKPRTGDLLGYYAEAEIFDLRRRIAELERIINSSMSLAKVDIN